jgi:hypothetical protein
MSIGSIALTVRLLMSSSGVIVFDFIRRTVDPPFVVIVGWPSPPRRVTSE